MSKALTSEVAMEASERRPVTLRADVFKVPVVTVTEFIVGMLLVPVPFTVSVPLMP